MQNHDWIDLLRLIPSDHHNPLVLTTISGMDLIVETILRTELTYLVFRGRISGSTDEGRVFFLPYRQIDFLQINRQVKEVEIRKMYGEFVEENPRAATDPLLTSAESSAETGQEVGDVPMGGPGVSPPAPTVVPSRSSVPGIAARLSGSSMSVTQAPTVTGRLSNLSMPTHHPQPGSLRLSNVPSSALAPPVGTNGGEQPVPPRNSILERLRAQRNMILPPRPPSR
jgi:hypothetical protein